MKKTYTIVFALIFLLFTGPAWAYDISPEDVSGSPGSSVVVPIKISNVGGGLDVDAFGFTLTFDKDVLTFDDVDKLGTLAQSFSLVAGQETEPGKVKVNGALFGTPVHIDADGLFLKMKFNVKSGASKNSALSLSDFKDDIATATTGSATGTPTLPGAFEISPADVQGKTGDTVVVPVNISNIGTGLDIDAFGFTFQFDKDVLEFVEADKAGTLVQNFSLVEGQITEPGKVKVNGAMFGTPVHIGANGLFLKMKFTVKKDAISTLTLLDFKDDIQTAASNEAMFKPTDTSCIPTDSDTDCDGMLDAWEIEHFGTLDRTGTDDYDGDGYTEKWEHDHATDPKDPNDPPPPPGGILELPDMEAEEGKTISVPLKLNNKNNEAIEAVDVKVEFSNAVLVATDATLARGILDGKNYGITYQVDDGGKITVSIFANGNTFTGSGIVAYLNFYMVGDEATMTKLTFAKAQFNEKK